MADDLENQDGAREPDRELVAEFDRLYEKLNELIQRTQNDDGGGETVRMTIRLPREWAILAAWMRRKERMRTGGDPGPLRRDIDLDPRLGDWSLARSYVGRALNDHFHEELRLLATGRHELLYPPPPKEEEPPDASPVPGVPREYSKAGITTPEAAAEYSADIIGFVSVSRAHESAGRAEREGRAEEAEFYRAVLAILLEWYGQPAEPVTGDEDLPGFPPEESATPPPPKRVRKSRHSKAQ